MRARPSGRGWSRRSFVAAISALRLPAESRKGRDYLSEVQVYSDRTTEFPVTRLTSPSHSSFFPAYYNRFISGGRGFLLHSSDRSGKLEAYQFDLKSGVSRQLTDSRELAAWSLYLRPDAKSFLYFDGPALQECNVNNLSVRTLYETPAGVRLEEGLTLSSDGRRAVWVESDSGRWRIRALDLRRRKADTLFEDSRPIRDPQVRPGRRELLFRDGAGALWTSNFKGRSRRTLDTAPGKAANPLWAQDGDSILYLNLPEDRRQLNTLREHYADTRQDRLIAKTTQFASFGVNADASVFVGASGGRATPYILLLLRTTGREFTLCEHRATNPSAARPVFSPDSRYIFFQSDCEGRNCLYSMKVDQLVEATETRTSAFDGALAGKPIQSKS